MVGVPKEHDALLRVPQKHASGTCPRVLALDSISIFPIMRPADAGWSSLVARWAHNPKVAGSNPVPATTPIGTPVLIKAGVLFFVRRPGGRL